MPIIAMPDGTQVQFPDNPTPEDLATLKRIGEQMTAHMKYANEQSQNDAETLAAMKADPSFFTKMGGQAQVGLDKAWQGLKQAFPKAARALGAEPLTNEEMKQKKAFWDAMAKEGGGGKVSQAVGQALPGTAAVGAATAALPAMGLLGGATVGALAGGAQGYTEPVTGDSQRLGNALVGAGLGAAVPVGAKVISPVLSNVASGFSKRFATGAAGRDIAQSLAGQGEDVSALAKSLRTAPQTTPIGTRPSAAQAAGSDALAALEARSRSMPRQALGWSRADGQNNALRSAYLDNILGDPIAAGQTATAQRDLATRAAKNAALQEVDAQSSNMAQGLGTAVQKNLQGIRALPGNDELARVLGDINKQLSSGPVKASDVARMREALSKVQNPDPNARAAIDAIDSVMASRSKIPGKGSMWDDYNQSYRDMSAPVDEADALAKLKASHYDVETGAPLVASPTDPNVPQVSGNSLAQALAQNRTNPTYATRNIPQETEDLLSPLIQEQRQSQLWRGVTGADISPGGGTAESLAQARSPMFRLASDLSTVLGSKNKQDAMAALLRNPQQLGSLITPSALSPSMNQAINLAAINALRGTGQASMQ